MRSKYKTQDGTEALFDEADTAFSGQNEGFDLTNGMTGVTVGMGYYCTRCSIEPWRSEPLHCCTQRGYAVGQGMRTDDAEDLGTTDDNFNQMAFSIEKVTVTAKSRALKAEYSLNWHKTSRRFTV